MKMLILSMVAVLVIAASAAFVTVHWDSDRQVREDVVHLTLERDRLRSENSKLIATRVATVCVAPDGSTPVLQTSFRDESTHTDRTVVVFARTPTSSEPPFGIRVCETGKEPVVVDTRTADEAFSLLEGRVPHQSPSKRMDWRNWSRTH